MGNQRHMIVPQRRSAVSRAKLWCIAIIKKALALFLVLELAILLLFVGFLFWSFGLPNWVQALAWATVAGGAAVILIWKAVGAIVSEPAVSASDVSSVVRDQVRLGILHLILGTACAAVYLSALLTARQAAFGMTPASLLESGAPVLFMSISVVYGLGWGLAFGSLLLWAVRRFRGGAFPRHPGEYLLVVLGVLSLLTLGMNWLFSVMTAFTEDVRVEWWNWSMIVFHLIGCVVWIRAALLIKASLWRWFFLLHAAMHIAAYLIPEMGYSYSCYYGLHGVMAVVLIGIVTREHLQGVRYPWEHWLGVTIRLQLSLVSLGWFLARTRVWEMAFPNL